MTTHRDEGATQTTTTARHFGEPDITSSPIYNPRLKCYIDCGSFIRYEHRQKIGYGRLISTVVGGDAVVNEYANYEEFIQDHDEIESIPMQNPYIEVAELIQTTSLVQIPHHAVSNIIFMFRKDDIVNGFFPCEGVECAFLIRFRFVTDNLTVIPCGHCLPFPCSYQSYHLTTSYPKQIFDSLQRIRSTVTQMMCRKGKNLGRNFISGSITISLGKESWVYLVDFFKAKNINVHGPFQKKKRELQIRNGIELNSV